MFLPAVLCAVVIFLPGILVALASRLRGFDAFAAAPALSVAMISISAILAPMLGVGWSLWIPLVFALLVAALGFVLTWAAGRLGSRRNRTATANGAADEVADVRVGEGATLLPQRWFSRDQGLYWISFAIGAILLARNTTNSLGNPEWISQTWDNNFHLNVIRFIEDTGNASSLHVAALTSGDNPVFFYPAAWHDIVSLVFLNADISIPAATNVVALLTAAVIWPLSVLFMVRQIVTLNAPAVLSLGALCAAFTGFPILLLFFGVLYPNLLGISVLPVGIGLVAQLFRVGWVRRLGLTQTLFLGFFVGIGVAISHPNAVMSLLVIVVPIFITRAILQIVAAVRSRTPWWVAALQVAGIGVLLWVVNYLWGVVRPEKEAGIIWNPMISQAQAYGEAVLNAPIGGIPQWFVTILLLLGIFALFKDGGRHLWLVASWCVVAFFYGAARSLPWEEDRYWVVGVWYHDSYRLAALLPLVCIPVAAYGISWLTRKIADSAAFGAATRALADRKAAGFGSRAESGEALGADRARQLVTGVLAVIAVLLVSYFGQTAKAITDQVASTYFSYVPGPDSRLLSTDEKKLLDELDSYVPADEQILVQPFTGGSLAYAYADRKVSAAHAIYEATDNVYYLEQNLNKAKTDPKVCEIVNKDNLNYYLDFGKKEVNGDDHTHRFPGYENLKGNGILKEVKREGDAALYEVAACD